jgi:hypothetical protein
MMLHCVYVIFFLYSSVYEHLVISHSLTLENSVMTKISMQGTLWYADVNFGRYIPRSGIVQWYCSPVFSFLRKLHIISRVAELIYITITSV